MAERGRVRSPQHPAECSLSSRTLSTKAALRQMERCVASEMLQSLTMYRQVKYIIRTDIMYERRPGICDSEKVLKGGGLELLDRCLPQDLEAYRMYLEAKECEAVGDTDRALSLYRRMVKMSPVRMNANG